MAPVSARGWKRRWMAVAATVIVASSLPVLEAAPGRAQVAPGDQVLLAAGDIAKCDSGGDEATAALVANELAANPNASVAMLGDGAYPDGDLAHYQQCYEPSWGRFKARTRPATGNHEYANASTRQAEGYFDYWGPAAGPRPQGYYSSNL